MRPTGVHCSMQYGASDHEQRPRLLGGRQLTAAVSVQDGLARGSAPKSATQRPL